MGNHRWLITQCREVILLWSIVAAYLTRSEHQSNMFFRARSQINLKTIWWLSAYNGTHKLRSDGSFLKCSELTLVRAYTLIEQFLQALLHMLHKKPSSKNLEIQRSTTKWNQPCAQSTFAVFALLVVKFLRLPHLRIYYENYCCSSGVLVQMLE